MRCVFCRTGGRREIPGADCERRHRTHEAGGDRRRRPGGTRGTDGRGGAVTALKPCGGSAATFQERSRARPARPSVPSSNSLPISVTPCGTRRGGENFGSGCSGSGAQSLRASETSTNPARSVSDGWPVKLLMVSISSRSEGTSSRSTCEKTRAISCATCGGSGRPARNPPRKGSAPGGTDSATHRAPAPSVASAPPANVSSSKAAAPSAKRISCSES